MSRQYVVAAIKPWNVAAFRRRTPSLPGHWHLIERPEELTVARIESVAPRYIFFPHWSWRVPAEIVARFECVCFHMTDVPYGRGGSPLQNLILRGHKSTMLTALRMVEELDAGPVYLKRPMALDGRAEEIFERVADLVYDLVADIVAGEPGPTPQAGQPIVFRRRTPEESLLPNAESLAALYDFIRMLDAPTYPKAFIDWEGWRFEFDQAQIASPDTLQARVVVRKAKTP